VRFWHFRQLPNYTMTILGRTTASVENEMRHSFSDI